MNELECHTLIFLNSQRGWNERGGGAKVAKFINMEVGINVDGGNFCKKLVIN